MRQLENKDMSQMDEDICVGWLYLFIATQTILTIIILGHESYGAGAEFRHCDTVSGFACVGASGAIQAVN